MKPHVNDRDRSADLKRFPRISLKEAREQAKSFVDLLRVKALLEVPDFPSEVLVPDRAGFFLDRAKRTRCANTAVVQLVGGLRRLPKPPLYLLREDATLDEVRCSFVSEGGLEEPCEVRVRLAGSGAPCVARSRATCIDPDALASQESRPAASGELAELEARFEAAEFYGLRADGRMGLDGETWTLERLSFGRYHLVTRWSPPAGPLRELLEFLRAL